MTPAPDGWSASLRCESRTGAAHLRRGVPCQDASGFWTVADAAGEPVRLLVVSDGHGGSRYTRSDVGSRLACSVALELIGSSLVAQRVGQPGQEAHWRRWLAESLPQRLVAAWGQAVRQHWQSNPGSGAVAFSPVPYGATLGVLVLTPRWWGHTGLGDWDLVRIEASGDGHLVSEEPAAEAAGEATCSLCMQGAARQFAARSGLHPLSAADPPFSLLLATDGIRKSCGSDADFLTLVRYLVDLPDTSGQGTPAELAAALDHISSQGSGDDVSVAIGRWQGVHQPVARSSPVRLSQPRVVQPPPPAGSPSRAEATAAAAGAVSPPLAAIASRPSSPSSTSAEAASVSSWLWLASVLAGLGVLALLAWTQRWGPFADGRQTPAALTAAQRLQLQGQIAQLCGPADRGDRSVSGSLAARPGNVSAGGATPQAAGQPPTPGPAASPVSAAGPTAAAGPAIDRSAALALRIRGTLNNRSSSFRRLLSADRAQLQALLQASATDPLGALIAWSRLEPSLAPGLTPLAHAARHSAGPLPVPALRLCPELSRELQRQWRQRAGGSPAPLTGGRGALEAVPPSPQTAPVQPARLPAGRPLAPTRGGSQDGPAAIPQRQER